MSENTIIELQGLTKRYGYGDTESFALKDFDLTIKRGEFIMIMGPSGCGKTTLLNIIGLLDKATSGEYKLAGKSVDRISSRKKARFRAKEIGFIFQSFNLIPNLSVIENVSLPLIYNGYSKTRRLKMADTILEHFHLREREYYMPSQLSGGQQQRVAIARSLIANPSIILADEPTGNLDSRASHIIMEELQDIHALGNTIIMVTHNPALTTYATRVINMLDGEIDTDIKTVADQDLPKPGDPEKISVRVLSKKKKAVELEVDSSSPVIVSGNNITIAGLDDEDKPAKSTKKDSKKSDSKSEESEKVEKKTRSTRSRFGNIINKAKKAKSEKTPKKTKIEVKPEKSKNTKTTKKES